MPIEIHDKRERATKISTGAPAQPLDSEHVLVKPTKPYLEGKDHVGPDSKPYLAPRHHAEQLKANGLAEVLEPKKPEPVEEPVDEDESEDEPETEQPDDESEQARAPRRRGRPRKA